MAALHISAFGNKGDMTQFWAVGNILGWLFWIESQTRSTVKCLYEGFWSHAHLCFVGTVQTPEKLPIRRIQIVIVLHQGDELIRNNVEYFSIFIGIRDLMSSRRIAYDGGRHRAGPLASFRARLFAT